MDMEEKDLKETINKTLDEREQKKNFTSYLIVSSVIFLVSTIVCLFSDTKYLSIGFFVLAILQPLLPIILKKSPKVLAVIIYTIDALLFLATVGYMGYLFYNF